MLNPAEGQARRRRWELWLLLSMYLCYAGFMLCRNTIVVVSPAMIADPALGMDKTDYGRLMAWHSAGAIAGKLVTGVMVDTFGGRKMFLATVACVIAATAAFASVSQLMLLMALNFFAQGCKAAGWPAMANLIGRWYGRKKHGRVWGVLSTSSRIGVLTSTLALGALLTTTSWRTVLYSAAGLTVLPLVLGFFLMKQDPAELDLPPPPPEDLEEDEDGAAPHRLEGTTLKQGLGVIFRSARFWLISGALAVLTVMMDFINFIPIYLNENLGIDPGEAGMASSVFPAGCFLAVLGGGFLYDRLSKRQHVWVLGGGVAAAAACVVVLMALPSMGLGPKAALYVALAAIFFFGLTVSPAYYIPMSVFSIDFGGPHAGILVGLIDAFGYLGAMVFNWFGGEIAQVHGWGVFLKVLLTSVGVATVLVVWFLHLDAKAHARDEARKGAAGDAAEG